MIGITAGEHPDMDEIWGPSIYGHARTYVDAVTRAGGIPISVPLLEDEKILRELYEKLDAIVFSGGSDIDPAVYGSKPNAQLERVHRRRDDQELLLCKWATEDQKPILAICRGMQVVNVFFGGTLHQDILAKIPGASDHCTSDVKQDMEYVAHCLKIDPKSRLAKILGGTKMDTNSRHHQAVDVVGGGLKATAWAEDGVIEGLELEGEHFVIGVQSHPEALEASAKTEWRKLFQALVDAVEVSPRQQEPALVPALTAHR